MAEAKPSAVAPAEESATATSPTAKSSRAPVASPREADYIAIDENDSAYGNDDAFSETTSIASTLIKGHIENGRKYNALRDDYWGPVDEKQFETMDVGHFVHLIMESQQPNPLFRSPVKDPKRILDIGTGSGTWAMDAADKFPHATVHGVDLYPPPNTWVPPNCILEVEDVSHEWTWREKFDLVHMRYMLGAFDDAGWADLYKKIYDNLEPGGWIEQIEGDLFIQSDDGSLIPGSFIDGWGDNIRGCGERSGKSLHVYATMKGKIEAAGFVEVQEQPYKLPLGSWPKEKVLKEAGKINLKHWETGIEGWAMYLMTKFGAPKPWSADEVRVYVAKIREELRNPNLHIWHAERRVWARKPLE